MLVSRLSDYCGLLRHQVAMSGGNGPSPLFLLPALIILLASSRIFGYSVAGICASSSDFALPLIQ